MDSASRPVALACDVGGTKIAIGTLDLAGEILGEIENHPVPIDDTGAADPQGILDLIQPYLRRAQEQYPGLRGVGVSLCGTVNPQTGEAVLSPNLHWRNIPFGALAAARFGLPVFAATDVRQAALAEWTWGAARGMRHFAWVTIGTGFGGYLFLNGQPFEGAHDFAGNFGHNTVDEVHGEPCGCGKRGCVETYVAGPAIARQGQQVADRNESALLRQLASAGRVTTRMVFQAEAAGDPAAGAIVANVVRRLGIALAGLVNILDLEMLILGGGVMRASADFLPRIDRAIRQHLMTEEARHELRLVGESTANSALVGAAANVFIRGGEL